MLAFEQNDFPAPQGCKTRLLQQLDGCLRAGRVENGNLVRPRSLPADAHHDHHATRTGVGDKGENAILHAQAVPGQRLDLGFEPDIGRHAKHHKGSRLFCSQGIVGNQALGIDLKPVVLRNSRQALHSRVEKRRLGAH